MDPDGGVVSVLRGLAVVLSLVACSSTHQLPVQAAAELHRAAHPEDDRGESIYEGSVRRRNGQGPALYRYERRVHDLEDGLRSSHVTYGIHGDPILLHQADHDVTYALIRFRELHAQTGLVGEVAVDPDGTATFRTTVDGRTRTRVEPPGEPLHAGPTVFGHVLSRWETLIAGESEVIRFVVLQRGRSFRFRLRHVDGRSGVQTFEMVPTDPLVRLGVPRIEMTFDEGRRIVRYSGPVPPLERVGERLRPLDATVTYTHHSPVYR